MGSISAPSQRDHMGMFEEEQQIRYFFPHTPRPELMLNIPGFLIIEQSQVNAVALTIHLFINSKLEIPCLMADSKQAQMSKIQNSKLYF
jgi:hypothetical protein